MFKETSPDQKNDISSVNLDHIGNIADTHPAAGAGKTRFQLAHGGQGTLNNTLTLGAAKREAPAVIRVNGPIGPS